MARRGGVGKIEGWVVSIISSSNYNRDWTVGTHWEDPRLGKWKCGVEAVVGLGRVKIARGKRAVELGACSASDGDIVAQGWSGEIRRLNRRNSSKKFRTVSREWAYLLWDDISSKSTSKHHGSIHLQSLKKFQLTSRDIPTEQHKSQQQWIMHHPHSFTLPIHHPRIAIKEHVQICTPNQKPESDSLQRSYGGQWVRFESIFSWRWRAPWSIIPVRFASLIAA